MDGHSDTAIILVNTAISPGGAAPCLTDWWSYNPQNEMFRCFRTKCSISQNEMYLRESFSLSHQPNKKAPKKLTSPVLFYCLLIWLSRKKITNFTTNKGVVVFCYKAIARLL